MIIMEHILLYTDGSSRGNPGPGGYGAILKYNGRVKELSCGYKCTTNNRMELMAVIEGLSAIKRREIPVDIYSDSSYVVRAINENWLKSWTVKGFKKKKNIDLWRRYIKVSDGMTLNFFWLKGHDGHPENERCDFLAVSAALSSDLLVDEGYSPEESLF